MSNSNDEYIELIELDDTIFDILDDIFEEDVD